MNALREAALSALKSPTAGSAARYIATLLLGLVGVRAADQQVGELAAALLAAVGLVVSLYFSRRSDAKIAEQAMKSAADTTAEVKRSAAEAADRQ